MPDLDRIICQIRIRSNPHHLPDPDPYLKLLDTNIIYEYIIFFSVKNGTVPWNFFEKLLNLLGFGTGN